MTNVGASAPLQVILDCDPGHDDFVAIAVAARFTDLVAVTTVAGNAALAMTTHNALLALQLLGHPAPVHRGASRPLIEDPYHYPQIHGDSGLGGPRLPPVTRRPSDTSALECLIESSRAVSDLWVIATGPLTNLALAIRADPGIIERLAGISIMGGGLAFGNVSAAAEFNFWADPHAAAIVLSSGIRCLLAPLDVTHQFLVTDADADKLRAGATTLSVLTADLFDYFIGAYSPIFFGRRQAPLHDPLAVLHVTHPELFEDHLLAIEIALQGPARGMMIADRRSAPETASPNSSVALGVDSDSARALILESILRPTSRDA